MYSHSLDDLPCSGRCGGCDPQGHAGCIPSDPPGGAREERKGGVRKGKGEKQQSKEAGVEATAFYSAVLGLASCHQHTEIPQTLSSKINKQFR